MWGKLARQMSQLPAFTKVGAVVRVYSRCNMAPSGMHTFEHLHTYKLLAYTI